MKTSILAGSALAASLVGFAAPVQAQLVSADVVVRSGPVRGHVAVSDGYSTYRRPPVVYERPGRVVVVERVRPSYFGEWKRHGYRQVRVYYVDGRYYDRYDRRHPGMREIIVYERNGRYYRAYDRDDHRGWDRDGDDYRDRRHDRDHDRGRGHGRHQGRDHDRDHDRRND